MKKSSVVAITLLGCAGGLAFALGMCMCLLPEWGLFAPGAAAAAVGAALLLAIWPVRRRAAGKPAIGRPSGAHIAIFMLGVLGALALGAGLAACLDSVSAPGLAVGIAGLALLLAIIPVARKAAGKGPVHLNAKRLAAYLAGIAGTLVLGVGMCMVTVWGASSMVPGILVGCAGLTICILNAVLNRVKTA